MAKRKSKLNEKQLQLLKLLYKFRFVSAALVARHKGVRKSAVNNAFTILMDHGLIDRRYEISYRIQGKGATYYLTPEALRFLRDKYKLNEVVLHSMYKNKSVSDTFVDDNLTLMLAYLNLRDAYPGIFNIFTKSELGDFDYFPEPKPNLYLSRKTVSDDKNGDYMLDIFNDNRLFIIKKRIQVYIDHFDSGEWGDEEYSTILLVCPDPRTEERVQKYIESLLEDFELYTTTKKALLDKQSKETEIWTDAINPENLIDLV